MEHPLLLGRIAGIQFASSFFNTLSMNASNTQKGEEKG